MFGDTFVHTARLGPRLALGMAITVLVIAAARCQRPGRLATTPRRRRGEGVDAVLPVTSRSEAVDFAHSLLAAPTSGVRRSSPGAPGTVDDDGIWRAVSERPLAALVYTASQQPRPLAWLVHTVSQLGVGADDTGWRAALAAMDDSTWAEWLCDTSAMDWRQRASVAMTMRDAVAEYAAGQR